jgi:hypothetical protein
MRARSAAAVVCLLLASGGSSWAQFEPRIVNGSHTQLFPTTGALLVNLGGQLGAICSGTLIGCDAFLTAAHCVCPSDTTCTPNPAPYRIFLQHGGILTVDDITVHPTYLFGTRNDVAVVTLSSPVTGISPTAINVTGSPAHGTAGTIAGFGITKSGMEDSGIKRSGNVVTASCQGEVPQSEHVCWLFEKPIDAEGENSNTCSGDSGGPLFIDFGGGAVVAGVTSGGFSSSCLPTDLSFDADVFANRTFIEANADLSNPTCGSISQVGDGDTQVIAGGPAAITRSTQKCRREVRKHASNYARAKLGSMQRCLDGINEGSLDGDCPDASAVTKITRADDRVDPAAIAKRCSPTVTAASFLGASCATAADATDLRACVLTAADAAVAAMLDRQYADADPAASLAEAEAVCQARIANAMNRYAGSRLRALLSCHNARDTRRTASCPDARTQLKLDKLVAAVQPSIERSCTNPLIAALDAGGAFGGSCAGAATTADIAACEMSEHDAEVDQLLALVNGVPMQERSTFEVAPGTDRLRVTLNGLDDGINDLDLFLRFGAPPTTSTYDERSIDGGVFEAVEVESPAPGTWHVFVDDFAGTDADYQVTVTLFQP